MELREIFEESNFMIEEAKDSKTITARLRYPFILGDKRNGNGRVYPSKILRREIQKMKARIAESKIPGMLEHPKFTSHTELGQVAHLISEVDWLESEKKGIAVSSILRTSKGKDLLILLKSGLKLGASVRGFGNVSASGEVQDDYRLESIDVVIGPSFGQDVEITSQNLIESGNHFLAKNPYLDERRMKIRYQFARKAGFKGSYAEYGVMIRK